MKARCFMVCMTGVLAFLSSDGGETTPPGYSQPFDTSPHRRPVISEDLAIPLRKRFAVPPQGVGPIFKLLTLIDVNNLDFNDGSEPGIAVNAENLNLIVVHGGFGGWGLAGQDNALFYVSINAGATWRRVASIDPPTNSYNTFGYVSDFFLALGPEGVKHASFDVLLLSTLI